MEDNQLVLLMATIIPAGVGIAIIRRISVNGQKDGVGVRFMNAVIATCVFLVGFTLICLIFGREYHLMDNVATYVIAFGASVGLFIGGLSMGPDSVENKDKF